MSSTGSTPPGWYPEQPGSAQERWWDGRSWTDHVRPTGTGESAAPVAAQVTPAAAPSYVVLQVVLKERFLGSGSGNLTELERVINAQAAQGYRLHTITTASSGTKGIGGGDRIQATMVFERLS
ncbi:DUF2510 domain-containing protein [Amnibacterium setariae]|uniref:DUF4177 domain-containing protein n=1 Tax=Amnibacterium setariae TaxID=2306585 RepID=A0A3A1TVK9_9MICO|nr:DUF2510 domain-containing protein [Amnibacterium setariae]RIX27839.1 DUF4177 domain-containing protein [Amnibacterium setariae]